MLPASTTDLVTRADYAPYGAVRGTDNLPTDHGWLNQVSDEASAGLVYLNARYYDPEASRFVSPDPLVKPMDPRTLDAYRYAENNPITYTDATGLWSCPGSTDSAGYKTCISMRTRLLQPEGFNYTSYTVGRERETKLWAIEQMKIRDAKANAEAAKFSWRHDVWDIAKPVLAGAATALVVGTVCLGGGAVTGGVILVACSAFAGASGALAHYYVATPSDQWNGGDARKAAAWGALWGGATGGAFWGASYLASVYPESTFLGAPSWMSSGSGSVTANSADDLTTVGRWMSPKEHSMMDEGKPVIEGTSGRTYVTNPSNPDAYPAGKGYFVQFRVPTSSLQPAGRPDWSVIPGPNVTTKIYGPPPPEMPSATCIVILCQR